MARKYMPTDNAPKGTFHQRKALSRNESKFFTALHQAIGDTCFVFPKMRLCDVIYNSDDRDFGRIRSKHIDFMLYDKKSFAPVCAVELDDVSHKAPIVQAHDQVKTYYLNKAGVPLLRYPVYPRYYITTLTKAIMNSKADTGMSYPTFPVNVEVEEIMAYDDVCESEGDEAQQEDTSTVADSPGEVNEQEVQVDEAEEAKKQWTEVAAAQTTPVIEAQEPQLSPDATPQPSLSALPKERPPVKHGLMRRIAFLFTGKL